MSAWIRAIFRAGAVNKGGIVRRSKADVLRNGGYKSLRRQVERLGFHKIRAGGQYVVICNNGDFKLLR